MNITTNQHYVIFTTNKATYFG